MGVGAGVWACYSAMGDSAGVGVGSGVVSVLEVRMNVNSTKKPKRTAAARIICQRGRFGSFIEYTSFAMIFYFT